MNFNNNQGNETYKFFKQQLKKYKPYEIEASKRIINLNNVTLINFNDDYKFDFITSDNIKYEVKTDEASLKSPNFFIEYKGYTKLSGISITESHFYIISDTINYYLIETKKLIEIINNNTFKTVSTKDKSTSGYLINKKIIISNSISI